MIDIQDLTFSFKGPGQAPVLDDIHAQLPEGHFISLIGKSGSGKSTLFKILTQDLTPQAGQVTFQGRPLGAQEVAYMPQKDLLLPWASVLDNVLLPQKLNPKVKVHRDQALAWLDKAGLAKVTQALPQDLSGGMRQRVAFVRTLMMDKPILLLDEPFGALDYFTQMEMQAWLLDIWQDLKTTVILITHNIEEAVYLSDQVMILHPAGTTPKGQQLDRVTIDLDRPRRQDMRYLPQFVQYKKVLEEAIHHDL